MNINITDLQNYTNYKKFMQHLFDGVVKFSYKYKNKNAYTTANPVRSARGTLNIDYINAANDSNYSSAKLDSEFSRNGVPQYITYYDTDSQGFRRFTIENFIGAEEFKKINVESQYDVEYEFWKLEKDTDTITAKSVEEAKQKFYDSVKDEWRYDYKDFEIMNIKRRNRIRLI